MAKRFVSIWFRHLKTDWFVIKQPQLKDIPFVLTTALHGKMMITEANALAQTQGIDAGMALADARVIIPSMQALDDKPGLSSLLLKKLALWCIRFTPVTALDPPDGIILDVTGCAHLWGDEECYLTDIIMRLKKVGYHVRAAMADTIGTAWAITRFGKSFIVEKGHHITDLLALPPAALRLDADTVERLHKLGLNQVKHIIDMPRSTLRRRFGQQLLQKLNQALGREEEIIQPVEPVEAYQERLPCLEPIVTATGIEIAMQQLLDTLCQRLQQERKGLRVAIFKGYRIDGRSVQVKISTNRPSCNAYHLFKLFEIQLPSIEPGAGIELFLLQAPVVEDHAALQSILWQGNAGLEDIRLSELVDRLSARIGAHSIHRYLPDEHYWPERSVKPAGSFHEKKDTCWKITRPRPLHLLPKPEPIEVAAPIPDYPPMLFRYKGKVHHIKKADGPERIEREWWLDEGEHRDYYALEDEAGYRYWVFRSGHYAEDKTWQWFICGFFA